MARKWAKHVQVHSELAIAINSGRSISNGNQSKVLCESLVSSARKSYPSKSSKDDLFLCLRHLLLWGRLIGIVPVGNLHLYDNESFKNGKQSTLSYPYFRWKSLPVIPCLLAIFLQILNVSVNFYGMLEQIKSHGIRSPFDFVKFSFAFFQNFQSLFTYTFFLLRARQLCKLLASWQPNPEFATDTNLKTYVDILGAIFMFSIIGENIVFHLTSLCPRTSDMVLLEKNMSVFQVYYHRSHSNWAKKVPYNSILTAILFLNNKLTVYSATYGDVIIMVLCRAVYYKFKIILHLAETEETISLREPFSTRLLSGHYKWNAISKMYFDACEFTNELNDFLNPLIFISYFSNVYFIALQIQLGFRPSFACRFIEPIYFCWAIVHSVSRIAVITLTAAKVHDYSKGMQYFVHRCPNELYSKQVERLEQMTMTPVGLSGLGSFTITKPLILSIASVVFTFEVILAQSTNMHKQNICEHT